MKTLRKKAFVLTISLIATVVNAQQSPIYTQYNMNRFLTNPAVAGIDGLTTICLTAREQWLGFKGAPHTHSISVDTRLFPESFIMRHIPVRKNAQSGTKWGRIGIGANLYNDHYGQLDKTGLETAYSYHIPFASSMLSFGLGINLYQFTLNTKKLIKGDDEYDPLIDNGKPRLFVPDANVGIYYTTQKYYAGISLINAFRASIQFGNDYTGTYRQYRLINIFGGYRYEVNDDIQLEPIMLIKIPRYFRALFDFQLRTIVKDSYWAGISYRTGKTMSFFGGTRVDRYFIGYAFDVNFTSIMKYTLGTHEIIAAVKLGKTAKNYKWINNY